MTVVGSKKMIVYDDVSADARITIYDKGVRAVAATRRGAARELRDVRRVPAAPARRRRPDPEGRLRRAASVELQHFVDCIRSGERR